MEALGIIALPWRPPSLPEDLQLWLILLSCLCFEVGQLQSHASDVCNVRIVSSSFVSKRVPELVEVGPDSSFAYQDLVERGQLTRVDQKPKYSSQQGLQAVQDLDILGVEGFFLFRILLRVLRQGISNIVSLALTIVDWEVVVRELLSLADLSKAQTLCLYELTKVVVVDEYKHLMLRPF